MTEEEVKEVNKEANETGKSPEKTFSARWLRQAYRIVNLMIIFSVGVFITQVILFVLFPEKELIIPGQVVIYSSMGAVTTALVGGEKIASKIKQNGKVNV